MIYEYGSGKYGSGGSQQHAKAPGPDILSLRLVVSGECVCSALFPSSYFNEDPYSHFWIPEMICNFSEDAWSLPDTQQ